LLATWTTKFRFDRHNRPGANAGASLGEYTMVIWDEKDIWGPGKDDRCTFCRGQLRPPLVMWSQESREEINGWFEDTTAFICSECCLEKGRGLSNDMRQIKTAKEAERMGFRHAGRRAAVSGGFLMTTTGTDKQ
jgi:hypothetical protein